MDKAFWGKRIAAKLHSGEKHIDDTICSLMDLIRDVQEAQADMNVSAVATNAGLAKAMEAMSLLQEARTSLTASHRRFEQLGEQLGIRTTGYGGYKPPGAETEDEVAAREAVS